LPACLQFFLLMFCPESPKYSLQTKNDRPKAEKDLIFLRDRPEAFLILKNKSFYLGKR
jgi:hypothetical protein